MSPLRSDDLTEIFVVTDERVVLFRSPDTAEHRPDYGQVGDYPLIHQLVEHLQSSR